MKKDEKWRIWRRLKIDKGKGFEKKETKKVKDKT
jgi:hypothetical protein